jgi:hypothetical protein
MLQSLPTCRGFAMCGRQRDEIADDIMVTAEKHHDDEDYDRYEALEGEATTYSCAASTIRSLSPTKG